MIISGARSALQSGQPLDCSIIHSLSRTVHVFAGTKSIRVGLVADRKPIGATSMIMENLPWLLPAWLIGAPFVLGLVEYLRLPKSLR